MIDLTIFRSDFRKNEMAPFESLFEWILKKLEIPEEDWSDIHEITIKNIFDVDIEY